MTSSQVSRWFGLRTLCRVDVRQHQRRSKPKYLKSPGVEWCQNRTRVLLGIEASLAATRFLKPYRLLRDQEVKEAHIRPEKVHLPLARGLPRRVQLAQLQVREERLDG